MGCRPWNRMFSQKWCNYGRLFAKGAKLGGDFRTFLHLKLQKGRQRAAWIQPPYRPTALPSYRRINCRITTGLIMSVPV